MTFTGAFLVFILIFVSDIFWVKCVKSVQLEQPFMAGVWAIGIFLPTAIGTVAYVHNPWLLIPACLGHFSGTAFTVWLGKNTKQEMENELIAIREKVPSKYSIPAD